MPLKEWLTFQQRPSARRITDKLWSLGSSKENVKVASGGGSLPLPKPSHVISKPSSRKCTTGRTSATTASSSGSYPKCCKVIAIDGNIGSGKSTLLTMLKDKYQHTSQDATICYAPERTHEWKGMLPLYYEDTARWSFPFQMQVLLSHLRNFKEANEQKADFLFVERSPLAAQKVFGELLKQEGLISSVESDLFDDYMTEVAWHPDAILYLDCPPKACLDRIARRSTEGEGGIPVEYLEKLSEQYRNFLEDYEQRVPVIRIDSSREVSDIFDSVITEIRKLDFI